jgi:hypothetical protein
VSADDNPAPPKSPELSAKARAKRERLARALRDNLRRRKAQQDGRASGAPATGRDRKAP